MSESNPLSVAVVGATGAGKGSLLWSLIRAAAPAVRDGLVHLWVLDPKGGMELAAGRPLFDRFAYATATALADMLEAAVKVMQERAARLMGHTRLHTPSTDEPSPRPLRDSATSSLHSWGVPRDPR